MSLRHRCRRCGRAACTTVCMLMGGSLYSTPVWSQTIDGAPRPTPVSNVAAVEVGIVFDLSPLQPMLAWTGPQDERCLPATCFRGAVTVRANHRWQLQVKLDAARPIDGQVEWRPPSSQASAVVLSPLTWSTVQSGPVPTNGTELALLFAITGYGVGLDAAAQSAALGLALQYRVVAAP